MLDKRTMFVGLTAIALASWTGDRASATEPEKTLATYGEWTVRCVIREKLPPCDMLQVAMARDSGRQLLRLSLAHLGDGNRIGVQAWVPLGVLVSGGVLIQADGEAVQLDGFGFTRCLGSGCFIEGVIGEARLEPFKRGKQGALVVLDAAGKPRPVRLGFTGFIAALDAMKARNLEWWATRGKKDARER